jgi:hypothetical protein
VADSIQTRTLNAAGQITGVSTDSNADGVADSINTYTLNAAGQITVLSYDSNADGVADRIDTRTYNAAGQQTGLSYDYNADGAADRIDTYTLNASGGRDLTYFDQGNDGFERIIFGNGVNNIGVSFELTSGIASTATNTAEAFRIDLGAGSSSELVVSDVAIAALTNGNTTRAINVYADDVGDTVRLEGDFTANGTSGTFDIYEASVGGMVVGSILIDQDATVTIT